MKASLLVSSEGRRSAAQVSRQPSVRQQADAKIHWLASFLHQTRLLDQRITSSQRLVTCHLAEIALVSPRSENIFGVLFPISPLSVIFTATTRYKAPHKTIHTINFLNFVSGGPYILKTISLMGLKE